MLKSIFPESYETCIKSLTSSSIFFTANVDFDRALLFYSYAFFQWCPLVCFVTSSLRTHKFSAFNLSFLFYHSLFISNFWHSHLFGFLFVRCCFSSKTHLQGPAPRVSHEQERIWWDRWAFCRVNSGSFHEHNHFHPWGSQNELFAPSQPLRLRVPFTNILQNNHKSILFLDFYKSAERIFRFTVKV